MSEPIVVIAPNSAVQLRQSCILRFLDGHESPFRHVHVADVQRRCARILSVPNLRLRAERRSDQVNAESGAYR